MGFFEKIGFKSTTQPQTKTGWEELEGVAQDPKDNIRQQRKIEYCLTTKDYEAIAGDGLIQVDEDEFLRKLRTKEIDESDKREMLLKMKTPVHSMGEQGVFGKIGQNEHQMKILGHFSGRGFSNYANIRADSVKEMLDIYPTPIDFDKASAEFLRQIELRNGKQKYLEYEKDMRDFKKNIYGKRQEYWEQMQLLDQKAKNLNREKEHKIEEGWPEIEAIGSREGANILKNTEIDGDAFLYKGRYYTLTAESLRYNGLAPKYKIDIEGIEIGLSSMYKNGRYNAVMAYVKGEDDTWRARTYYQSNSAGLWRYLPDYAEKEGWYGKGFGEESLTLPFVLQKGLADVSARGAINVDNEMAESFFIGTAKRYNSKEKYKEAMDARSMRGRFYEEANPEAIKSFGNYRDKKSSPENLEIIGGAAPDFEKKIGNFEIQIDTVGKSVVDVYRSVDEKFDYMFLTDKKGRSWLGGIEARSGLTSCGVRKEWVNGGDFTTPPYEYGIYTDGYGDESDRTEKNSRYVGMWRGYLSKMPIIRQYQAAKRRETWR